MLKSQSKTVRSHIIKIGNSQGVRLPKKLLENSNIQNEIYISSENGKIIITPILKNRLNWDKAFQEMSENDDDQLLDINQEITSTWDEEEWEW
ncbi:MAG: AbrB/MazE/SpoVT family DNA-binding domain-containing protein [Cyanobacterium sp. T60_A2020_053]|nr:AbrB/MazE/SpoVT family DNA-binding domain-containing protein [Cyanobacterium sp. T60_A2020_053]